MSEEELKEYKANEAEKKKISRMKKKEKSLTSDNNFINSSENDKVKFHNNYEIMTNFQCCAICLIEDGVQEMIEITDEIKEFFISCGIQALYQKRIQEYRLTRSADFVKSIESETNEYGVMKNCKFICKKCYNSIRPKYRKISSNNKTVTKKLESSDDSYSTVDKDEGWSEDKTQRYLQPSSIDDITELMQYRLLIGMQRDILSKEENERTPKNLEFLEKFSPQIENFMNKSDKRLVDNIIKEVDIINRNIMMKSNNKNK